MEGIAIFFVSDNIAALRAQTRIGSDDGLPTAIPEPLQGGSIPEYDEHPEFSGC